MELEFRKFQVEGQKKWHVCVAQVGTIGISLSSDENILQHYFIDDCSDDECCTLEVEPLLFSKEIVRWQ